MTEPQPLPERRKQQLVQRARKASVRNLRRIADLHNDIFMLRGPESLVWPDICPVLGIPITSLPKGRKGMANDSASLDKVLPEAGYTPLNTRVISGKAKRIRRGRSLSELDIALKKARENAAEWAERAENLRLVIEWLQHEILNP
jgi:hypothetical protein